MADKQEKKQYELPPLKVEHVDAPQLQQMRLRQKDRGVPISEVAISMSGRMLKDPASGARVSLSSKLLQDNADNIKRSLVRDLQKIAKREGRRTLAVRVINDSEKHELVFFYEQKRVATDDAK